MLSMKLRVFGEKRWLLLCLVAVNSISLRAGDIKVLTRQDYYTTEKKSEVLFYLENTAPGQSFSGEIYLGNDRLMTRFSLAGGMNRIPVDISGFQQGETPLKCVVRRDRDSLVLDTLVMVKVLPPKANAVKTDRLTGSLIVQGLPFIPFGFYAYSPVYPTLPEEEVVRGFNMMSPYQKIEKKTFRQRKAYMDRCAALGMKVNYNLLSVAGGGGVGSKMTASDEEKRERLIHEVLAFRDHPALLAWYIADEPVGQGKPPGPLVETYNLIKKLDPYHPVTMVFMTPQKAYRYAGAMDIVMADPYPIPSRPVTEVEYVSKLLKKALYPEKPLWIVPQAFGGAEVWQREPTPSELRVMTYLALINGARGIQYFVRNGLNGFPKSVAAWDECGRIALETAELTPWYCGGEEVQNLKTENKDVRITGWWRDSSLVLVCVNTVNRPGSLRIVLPDTLKARTAEVMFENRDVEIKNHILPEMIDAFGTRVYKIALKKKAPEEKDNGPENMIVDPSFEYLPIPGVPSAAYARAGKDRGATYFVDSRVSHTGDHAVRMVTPQDGKGAGLSFFPAYLDYGRTYRFTLWAKAAPPLVIPEKRGFLYRLFHPKPAPPVPRFVLSAAGTQKAFDLTQDWRQYEMFITPQDPSQAVQRVSVSLYLDTRGTAWFDDLELVPVIDMETSVRQPGRNLEVSLHTNMDRAVIRYDLTGKMPDAASQGYTGPFPVWRDADIVAGVFRYGERLGTYRQSVVVHKALGRTPDLERLFSARYDAGGFGGLTDGLVAQANYKNHAWQGYNYVDLSATIDLDSLQEIDTLESHFLQQSKVWIFFPREVTFFVSRDGKDYSPVYRYQPDSLSDAVGPEILSVTWRGGPVQARFVRMVAKNMGICPDWAPGAGEKAWMFCDEVIVK